MFNSQQKREAALFLINGFLILLDTLIFGYVWYNFYSAKLNVYTYGFYANGHYMVIALFIAMYITFAKLYGGFDVNYSTPSELVYSHGVATIISSAFMYIIIWLLIRFMPNILPMVGVIAAMILAAGLWAGLAKKATDRLFPPKRTVLFYGNPEARENGEMIIRDLPDSFSLAAAVDTPEDAEDAYALLLETKAQAAMLCGVSSSMRNDIVKYCINTGMEAYVRPNIGDLLIKGAKPLQLSNLPVLLCRRSAPSILYLVIKRLMDILLSLIALVLFSPFMLVTAIAIKAYDHGPILYKQLRLTKDRKPFYVYKFRSMRVDAEKDGVARLASQNDDRITPIGKIIRSLRIDEMPQLFCILLGSMTIVGPRPERPEIAEQYEQEMPEFALRLQAKAGLTGYAQVYGKYNTTPYNKLQMDLQYIGSMNLVTDLKIIFATVKILFMPESTEGVSAGQTTAARKTEEENELQNV